MIFDKTVICGKCGNECVVADCVSTHTSGSADLDNRPSEELRSVLLETSVFRCEKCDYCSADLSDIPDNLLEIMYTDAYNEQVINPYYPKRANEYLCKSIILKASNDIQGAAFAAQYAAWVCDDEGNNEAAISCRKLAIELFSLLNLLDKVNFEDKSEFYLLMIDLMRRSGQFENAKVLCDERMRVEKNELFRKILIFQDYLIETKDLKRFTVEKAISYLNI
jgi:hypothetical protein